MTEHVAGTTSLRFALVLFVVLPLSLLLIAGTYSVLRVVESPAEQRMRRCGAGGAHLATAP